MCHQQALAKVNLDAKRTRTAPCPQASRNGAYEQTLIHYSNLRRSPLPSAPCQKKSSSYCLKKSDTALHICNEVSPIHSSDALLTLHGQLQRESGQLHQSQATLMRVSAHSSSWRPSQYQLALTYRDAKQGVKARAILTDLSLGQDAIAAQARVLLQR